MSTVGRTHYMGGDEVHYCQACHLPTSRKCSACQVCVFCSVDCEERAAGASRARIACAEHQKRTRAPENLGASAAHFVMLPTTPLKLGKAPAAATSQVLWEALFHGAQHYMYLLLSCSSSVVHERSAFGMAVVVADGERLSAGCQRCAFPIGKRSDAAAMVVGNMGALADAQLVDSPVQRAILVSGVVQLRPEPVVHFDAIYLARDGKRDAWTIRGIKPMWAQKLEATDQEFLYKMHYRPSGHTPTKTRHALALLERALLTPTQTPPPTSGAPATPAPGAATPAPGAGAQGQAPPRSPRPASSTAPPPPTWEALRARAQAEAEATTEAPAWTAQLQEALRQGS